MKNGATDCAFQIADLKFDFASKPRSLEGCDFYDQ